MNQSRCERGSEVVSALRTGSRTDELDNHLKVCAMCAETVQIAGSLLQYAASLRAEHPPAAADRIWLRGQVRKQELALKRATRPLLFMRVLSIVWVVACAAWLLHSFWRFDSQTLIRGWNATGTETAGVGAAIAALCIVIGAGYLIRDDKQSRELMSST